LGGSSEGSGRLACLKIGWLGYSGKRLRISRLFGAYEFGSSSMKSLLLL